MIRWQSGRCLHRDGNKTGTLLSTIKRDYSHNLQYSKTVLTNLFPLQCKRSGWKFAVNLFFKTSYLQVPEKHRAAYHVPSTYSSNWDIVLYTLLDTVVTRRILANIGREPAYTFCEQSAGQLKCKLWRNTAERAQK